MKRSEIKTLAQKTFDKSKSGGYKKLHRSGNNGLVGVSQRKIRRAIMEDKTLRKFNVKFTNKARPRPVRVKAIYDQHQIDLIRKIWQLFTKEKLNSTFYLFSMYSRDLTGYILLKAKHSSGVKKKLKKIYSVHGLPQKPQSDNGGEFKKHVKNFCTTHKVKMVRSRPCHPQAQGKVERSHHVLRQKIHYDMVKKRKHGIYWAKQLPDYA